MLELDKKITIERLFKIQDGCYVKNKEFVEKETSFVEDCIALIINRHIAKDGFNKTEEEKFKITHQFLDTALSSLINSYKLLLYGCIGDSLSLLRVSFEATVFQDYAVTFDKYEEVKKGVILSAKGKVKLNFDKALKALENKKKTDRGRLFGFFSILGSHLTANRMKYNYFELNGKRYPITAHAILDKTLLETIINIHMRIGLYMANILKEFYQKEKPDAILCDFFKQASLLEERYDKFGEK